VEDALLAEVDFLPNAEVLVSTTWDCNLRCSYCFLKEKTHHPDHARMSAQTARRLVDVLDRTMLHVESVCIHLYGGEPLTNLPALRAMVERAEKTGRGRFTFAITTNGTILSDEVFALLDRGNFQVIVSIDGPARVHDTCRRNVLDQPTHHLVIKFLEMLRTRTRCWVRGSAVVRSGWRLKNAVRYLRGLPVDVIKAQAVRVPDGAPFALSDTEKDEYLSDLEAVGNEIIDELENGQRPRDDRFSNRVLQILTGKSRGRFCGAGETTFGFLPDGTVTPCVLLDAAEHALGHIEDHKAGWLGAGRTWRKRGGQSGQCRGCSALSLCGGGCPAILPICGANECQIIRKNCEIARHIYSHFSDRPEMLLPLAGYN
jgi:uncharacterized protein